MFGALGAFMGLTSCVGDLDLLPTNPNHIPTEDFASDPEGAMRAVMADVYLNLSTFGVNGTNILGSMDGGMSTFQRAIFNLEEVPSDEANWQPTADAIPHSLSYGIVSANETVILGTYMRLMVNCSLVNSFIQTDFSLQNAQQQALYEEFVRQGKIIRGGMYFYLISLFGNVPWNNEDVLTDQIPPQLSTDFATGRRLVTEKVVNELESVVEWYKQNDPNNKPPYGYVGLDVAEALLVKFYLNYEVFTGTAAWDKCLAHAESIIQRLGNGGFNGSGLAYNYAQCFSFNNRTDSQNEIIWRIPQINPSNNTDSDPINGKPNQGLISWANGGFMINGFIGNSADADPFTIKQGIYNSANGWKCMSARKQLTDVFSWDATYTNSPDDRVTWWMTAKEGFLATNEDITQAGWGKNGFLPVKFTNWYIDNDGYVHANQSQIDAATKFDDDGNVEEVLLPVNYILDGMSPAAVDPLGIDYGMIRLAEIYLSAAEACLMGAGSQQQAINYANFTHTRAGLTPYTELSLQELRNERQRELYTECTRRTDLIRYGQWISGYTWNWKHGTPDGQDFSSNFNVYPIPTTIITVNGYVQNPGW